MVNSSVTARLWIRRFGWLALGAALVGLATSPASAHPAPAAALEQADRAIEASPDDPAAWLRRATLQLDLGAADAALRDLEAIASRHPRLDAETGRHWALVRARVAMATDDPSTAAALARDLVMENPGDRVAWRAWAVAERERGDLETAALAFEQLLARVDRPSPDLVLEASAVLEGLGRPTEALQQLRRGIARLGPAPGLMQRASALAARLGEPAMSVAGAAAVEAVIDSDHDSAPEPGLGDPTPGGAPPATVVRGPYLQQMTPTSVIVRFRTSTPIETRVDYGPSFFPVFIFSAPSDAGPTTEHAIQLTGLAPLTRYRYGLFDTAGQAIASAADQTFRTPPQNAASAGPTRVWVLGDSGAAGSVLFGGDADAVRDAFLDWNTGSEVDLVLLLGDNAYPNGTDAEYQQALFDFLPSVLRSTPMWPTLGNHDGNSADSDTQSGVYYDIFTLPTAAEAGGVASGTEAYYSFDHGGVHFVCLDSHDSDRSPGSAMLTWLEADLAANRSEWTIAFWHHPPYSRGSHDSDVEQRLVEMRQHALPILEAHGVDLVLGGHSHSYERSVLLHGHDGDSSTLEPSMVIDAGDGDPTSDGAYAVPTSGDPGAVYAVAGSSSRLGLGPLDHPVMTVSLIALGSLVLDIDGTRLDAAFIDDLGVVRDRFSIEHQPVLFIDGFENGLVAWSAAHGEAL